MSKRFLFMVASGWRVGAHALGLSARVHATAGLRLANSRARVFSIAAAQKITDSNSGRGGKAGSGRDVTPRSVDYSQWYLDVIAAGDLVDSSPVKGCMVIRPNGMALWDAVRENLDTKIKATGTQNAYFPLFIPVSFLSKEAEHVEVRLERIRIPPRLLRDCSFPVCASAVGLCQRVCRGHPPPPPRHRVRKGRGARSRREVGGAAGRASHFRDDDMAHVWEVDQVVS